MRVDPGGGGGPSWSGAIAVVPGELEASAPSFFAASSEVESALASVLPYTDAGVVGITDAVAASAFGRMAAIWSRDLEQLSADFGNVGAKLLAAGGAYSATDGGAMR